MLTEVLLHFKSEILFLVADFKVDFKRVVDFGQSAVCRVELDIDNGADDLDDSSFVIHVWLLSVKKGDLCSVR
jgi:acyl-CoA thioesterase FadM